jgi:hypothetical protein
VTTVLGVLGISVLVALYLFAMAFADRDINAYHYDDEDDQW